MKIPRQVDCGPGHARCAALIAAAAIAVAVAAPAWAQPAVNAPSTSTVAVPPITDGSATGTIGNTIRAEKPSMPPPAPPTVNTKSPDDDSSGDTITVTGGVPGAATPATPANSPATDTTANSPAEPAPLSALTPTTGASAAPAEASPPLASAPVVVPNAPPPDVSLTPHAEAPPTVSAVEAAPATVPPVASAPVTAPESAPAPVASAPAVAADTAPAVPAAATTPITAASIAPPVTFAAPEPDAPAVAAPEESATVPAPSEQKIATGKKSKKAKAEADNNTKVASNPPADGAFAGLQFGNSKSPIDIKSESMSLDYEHHAILWTGHVHANQANAQLTADNLHVNYLDKEFKQMKDIVAEGNVRISQGTRWATGNHGVMDQTRHTMVLTGSPVVHDGNDQITGSKITVYLDTGRSVVEGAHAVIFPHQGDEADNSSGAHPSGNQ